MILAPWAVLLCKLTDSAAEPHPRSYYERLFTGTGVGSGNLVDYFDQVSHGRVAMGFSRVFGWYDLPYSVQDYEDIADQNTRRDAIGAWALAAAKINTKDYYGIIVCVNVPVDTFGAESYVCLDANAANLLIAAHEVGHGFGLDHSRRDGSLDDYQDRWDIMSAANVHHTTHAEFGSMGPGLNASNMDQRGWLDAGRVWEQPGGYNKVEVELRPLHRRDLPGYLAARVGPYLVEFRAKSRWDAGFARHAIFIHRSEDNRSYLMEGRYTTPTRSGAIEALVSGSTFHRQESSSGYIRQDLLVEVRRIDPAGASATVRMSRTIHVSPRRDTIVGRFLGGQAGDDGGLLLIGDRLVRVPPRSPAFRVLETMRRIEETRGMSTPALRDQLRRSLWESVRTEADAALEGLTKYRVPTPAPASKRQHNKIPKARRSRRAP